MKRLLCWLFGHRWSPPLLVPGPGFTNYESTCRRCGAQIEGDWDVMESAGAWEHYRSPF